MVKTIRGAVRLIVDARVVQLEARSRSINSNRHWTNCSKYLYQVLLRSFNDMSDATDCSSEDTQVKPANALIPSIRV